MQPLREVRSGQCLTCTFRASCCSARLSRAQVQAFHRFLDLGQEKKGGGGSNGEGVRGGGAPALEGTKVVKQSDQNR